jgi:hypothetical protein
LLGQTNPLRPAPAQRESLSKRARRPRGRTASRGERRRSPGMQNSRFRLLPGVACPKNRASRLHRLAAQRGREDSSRAHGHPISLAETLVDPLGYRGACDPAVGWQLQGSSAGCDDHENHQCPKSRGVSPLKTRCTAAASARVKKTTAWPAHGATATCSASRRNLPIEARHHLATRCKPRRVRTLSPLHRHFAAICGCGRLRIPYARIWTEPTTRWAKEKNTIETVWRRYSQMLGDIRRGRIITNSRRFALSTATRQKSRAVDPPIVARPQ